MKYLITESQYNLLVESMTLCLKRRLNTNNFERFIFKAEMDFPQLCYDFRDEFDYADAVIGRAADDFLMEDESFFDSLGESYDDIHEYVVDFAKEHFGDYLLEVYQSTCEEYRNEDF